MYSIVIKNKHIKSNQISLSCCNVESNEIAKMSLASHVTEKIHHSKRNWYPFMKRVRPRKFE